MLISSTWEVSPRDASVTAPTRNIPLCVPVTVNAVYTNPAVSAATRSANAKRRRGGPGSRSSFRLHGSVWVGLAHEFDVSIFAPRRLVEAKTKQRVAFSATTKRETSAPCRNFIPLVSSSPFPFFGIRKMQFFNQEYNLFY